MLKFPDRLPTLSASQALQDLESTPRRPISTGLASLDSVLQGRGHDASSQDAIPGGISRGEVTEVYGPPGVGKTAIAYVIPFPASVHLLGQYFQDTPSWSRQADTTDALSMQIAASVLHSSGSVVWVGKRFVRQWHLS